MPQAHPKNVPGPFYVEDGCCITCGIPTEIAPDMFEWDGEAGPCYVSQQPATAEQLNRMLEALVSSEVDCIRYRGNEPEISDRIAGAYRDHCCDAPPLQPFRKPRTVATFRPVSADVTEHSLAAAFRAYLRAQTNYWGATYDIVEDDRHPERVSMSWTKNIPNWDDRVDYHHIDFGQAETGRLLARARPSIAPVGLSFVVHDWLITCAGIDDILWFSEDDDRSLSPGLRVPV